MTCSCDLVRQSCDFVWYNWKHISQDELNYFIKLGMEVTFIWVIHHSFLERINTIKYSFDWRPSSARMSMYSF